ncbi:dihydropteroate synthase [Paenibacillaceae bacterium]|nr:dihydropteroate synthase [Paenibacillaceae bacterium]
MKAIIKSRDYELNRGLQLHLGQRTLVMGILNVTPDSFSDGGRYDAVERAVAHAKSMVEQGADIIDVGGESTRPGSSPVEQDEELRRVVPAIAALREALPEVPISIDTYKAETARQALVAGAHIINDVWGLKADPRMADAAAEFACPVVLTHNRHDRDYTDFTKDVIADLQSSIEIAKRAGVAERNIWLDPGIGFAKNGEENVELLGRLGELSVLGYPLLLGTSRKLFIRQTLDLPVDDIVEGTAATVALGIAEGCQIIRVHDIKQMKRVAKMTDAIVYRQAVILIE